jgi:hypothetical protein
MTRQEIRDLARKRLGETTAAFWSDAELNSWINDAQRDIAYRSKSLKTNTTMAPADDTSEYVLSLAFPKVTSIHEVYFQNLSGEWSKLIPTSRTELDNMYPGWLGADSADEPTHYWWDREDDIFYLYPAVTTTVVIENEITTSVSVKCYYTLDSTDLSGDNDTSTLPSHLHLAIVDFVVATGFDSRGWNEKANDAWAKCYQRVSDYKVELHREREDDDLIMRNYR